jgi:hypothetical protein
VRVGAREVLHLVHVQDACQQRDVVGGEVGEFELCQFGIVAEFSPNADNGFLLNSVPLRGAHVSQC